MIVACGTHTHTHGCPPQLPSAHAAAYYACDMRCVMPMTSIAHTHTKPHGIPELTTAFIVPKPLRSKFRGIGGLTSVVHRRYHATFFLQIVAFSVYNYHANAGSCQQDCGLGKSLRFVFSCLDSFDSLPREVWSCGCTASSCPKTAFRGFSVPHRVLATREI